MSDIGAVFHPLPLQKFIRLCIEAMNDSTGGHEKQVTVVFRRGRIVLFLTSNAVVADTPDDLVMDEGYNWVKK